MRTHWRTLLRTLCLSVLVLAPSLAFAATTEALKGFLTQTTTAKGRFAQMVLDKNLKMLQQSTGTMQFSRPGKFRWEYDKPYEQTIVGDGAKLWVYDKDLNQVIVRKLGNAIGSSPAAILFGSNDLEKNFTLSEAGLRDGIEWLQAIPKTKDTQFEKIGIGLKDGVPVAMELRDGFGQISLLSFARFEKNPTLPANHFRFAMPKGADVLQQ